MLMPVSAIKLETEVTLEFMARIVGGAAIAAARVAARQAAQFVQ